MRSTGSFSLFKSFLFFAVSFLLIRCSNQGVDGHFAFLGPKTPYASPFEAKKIILSSESFNGNVEDDSSAKTIKALPIVVLVDNACVAKHCNENESDSFNCFFSKHAERLVAQEKQFYSFSLPNPMTQDQLDEYLGNKRCILGVTNQTQYQLNSFDDTYFNSHQDTYLDSVSFENSLSIFNTENLSPVKVVIIDSGVGLHSDLGGANEIPGVVSRHDLRSLSSKNNPECASATYTNENPSNTHGTFVAGIIGAKQNNNAGIAGLAKNAQIFSIAVGDCKGRISTTEIGNALLYSLQLGAEVINMSLGGATNDDPAVRAAIVSLFNNKAVLVAAAGNSFEDLRTNRKYPAIYSQQYPGFLTVAWGTGSGYIERGDQTTYGSNYSPDHVKILAPGTNITSTMSPTTQNGYVSLPGGIGTGSGSSFAAPIITSAATLAIGYLKKNEITYDERLVEYLLLEKGSSKQSSLVAYVKDGNVIDFSKLGLALKYLKDTGEVPQLITTTGESISYSSSLDQPVIQFTANWNLEATHLGARIGVFDLSQGCTYSAPCLIQDFELSGNSGSKDFTLTRDELIALMGDLSDPSFKLPIAIAIFYKIPNANGGFKNNYGLDGVVKLDIRNFDLNIPNARVLGEVTNLRTDMQYLYVKGWACLEGSNYALKTETILADGTAIPTDFSYSAYSSASMKTSDETHYVTPLSKITMKLRDKTSFLAGLEANPTLLSPCKTLTASQGFDIGIPIKEIKNNGWAGKSFSIRVTNPKDSSLQSLLKDKNGNTLFTFPEVNYQSTLAATTHVNRSTDNVVLTGNICSESPAPIHMEISFNLRNFRYRLKKEPSFPNLTQGITADIGLDRSLLTDLFDPNNTDRQKYRYYSPNDLTNFYSIDLDLSPTELQRHIARFPNFWPNAIISWSQSVFDLTNFIHSKGFRELDTGDLLTGYEGGVIKLQNEGDLGAQLNKNILRDRAGVSFKPLFNPERGWAIPAYDSSAYQYGEKETYSTDSFGFDTQKLIGDYLYRTYGGVKKVLRETKIFETAISSEAVVLASEVLTSSQRNSSNCAFQFTYQKQISEISRYTPSVYWERSAFLKNNETLQKPVIDDITKSMREVPLNVRFFQDGVLILNQVSNFNDEFINLPVLGRGN